MICLSYRSILLFYGNKKFSVKFKKNLITLIYEYNGRTLHKCPPQQIKKHFKSNFKKKNIICSLYNNVVVPCTSNNYSNPVLLVPEFQFVIFLRLRSVSFNLLYHYADLIFLNIISDWISKKLDWISSYFSILHNIDIDTSIK